ncbi:MAG TPA: hypothetical protein VG406_13190 [Isosphaeraceae bacterium]|jgi:hypothetical protein|nr:hypothetical protein [Isosphaeraceae bacterium]
MVTVDACFDCNNSKSKDDVYVRDFLLADMASQDSPAAHVLWAEKFFRSIETNRSEIARAVMSDASPEAVFSPQGDYLGHALSVPVERARLDRAFSLMVRGLWYHVWKELMPFDCKFDVYMMGRFVVVEAWEEMAQAGASLGVIKPDVFACQYLTDADYPFLSRWLLLFYGVTITELYTIPNGLDFSPRRKVLPTPR